MNDVVVDSSVVAKWVLAEPDSALACVGQRKYQRLADNLLFSTLSYLKLARQEGFRKGGPGLRRGHWPRSQKCQRVLPKATANACLDRADVAIDNLRKALEHGYRNLAHMEMDTDVDLIRNDARYKEVIKKYAK